MSFGSTFQPHAVGLDPPRQELPQGWEQARSSDLVSLVTSGSRGWAAFYAECGPVFLRIGNLDHGSISLDLREVQRVQPPDGAEGTRTRVKPHDILISITADLGMVAVVPAGLGDAFINQHIALVRPVAHVDHRYLAWYFASEHGGQRQFASLQRGATKMGLGLDDIRSLWIPFAPLEEQHRIVAAIEAQFSRLDAAVANLRRVQANLKRYRAAVLKAACEGRLVATEAGDGELPKGWNLVTLGDLLESLRNGISAKPDADSGLPILRISAVRPMALDTADHRFLRGDLPDFCGYALQEGDLLFTRYNGTRELVGVCAVVPRLGSCLVYPDKLIRARLKPGQCVPVYVALAANVGVARAFIAERIRTTAGQSGVSGADLRAVPIPLPPLAEQHRIVAEVGRRLSVIQAVETAVTTNLRRAATLRQAILRQAFEGKLVPQDPNDEPASALLERIRAERARADAPGIGRTKGRRGLTPPLEL